MPKKQGLLIRKSVHLITGCLIFALTYLVERHILLLLMTAGAIFSFSTFNYGSLGKLHKTPESSIGTLFYPVGVISSFIILYNQPPNLFRAALLVLTISDTAAYSAGQILRFNGSFRLFADKKSFLGITAFSAATLVIIYLMSPDQASSDIFYLILSLVVAVNLEVISFRGSDNFTIPFGLALFFLIYFNHPVNSGFVLTIILIMSVGSFLLFRYRILDRKGSIAAYLLGVYFSGILGLEWFLPVLLFFLSSVVLTHLHTRIKGRESSHIIRLNSKDSSQNTRLNGKDSSQNTRLSGTERSQNTRNIWQVTANIAWAATSSVLYLIFGHEVFIMFFIALVAAVTSDTWASELGPLLNRKSYSLRDNKFHPAGITGGISAGGTLAALSGSAIVSAFAFYLFFGNINPGEILLLSLAGFFSCFTDSLLGAFAEDKWSRMSFFINNMNVPTPNDVVNLLGSITAPLFYLVFKAFI